MKKKKKNQKAFNVRMDPELVEKVNKKREQRNEKWSAVVEWLFNYYLEKL